MVLFVRVIRVMERAKRERKGCEKGRERRKDMRRVVEEMLVWVFSQRPSALFSCITHTHTPLFSFLKTAHATRLRLVTCAIFTTSQ